MAIELTMPALSQTTDTVKLVAWLVKEGDEVRKGQPVCGVETDKVTMEVESFAGGTVLKLIGRPGEEISAGRVILLLGEPGEVVPEAVPGGTEEGETARKPSGKRASAAVPGGTEEAKTRATPLVRNLAEKKGLDLAQVPGSGPRGLITKEDLTAYEAALAGGKAAGTFRASRMVRQRAEKLGLDLGHFRGSGPGGLIVFADLPSGGTEEPVVSGSPLSSGLSSFREEEPSRNQLAVAKALSVSAREIPQYSLGVPVDLARLTALREREKTGDGGRLSIYTLYLHAVSRALRDFPRVNGCFRDNRNRLYEEINLGFALAEGRELYVPVVRQADRKNLQEIDEEVKRLTARGKSGNLAGVDLTGCTFTVSNLGVYPVTEFRALVTPGQAGILALGRSGKTILVDEDNRMRVAECMVMTGSFDHRLVNGAEGAAFLAKVKEILEKEL